MLIQTVPRGLPARIACSARYVATTINQGNFNLSGLLVSFGGAIILLVVVNLFRRGRAR